MKQSDLDKEFRRMCKADYSEDDIDQAIEDEEKMEEKTKEGPLAKFKEDISTLFKMLKNRSEFNFSKKTVGLIVAVLSYIISPFDIVPDLVPLVGLLDDAALLTMVLGSIKGDIETYKRTKIELWYLHRTGTGLGTGTFHRPGRGGLPDQAGDGENIPDHGIISSTSCTRNWASDGNYTRID